MNSLSRGMGADDRRIARIESFLAGLRKESITTNVFGSSKRHRMDVLGVVGGPVADELAPPFVPIFSEVDNRTPQEIASDNQLRDQFYANADKMSEADRAAARTRVDESLAAHRAKSSTFKVKVTQGVIFEHFGADGKTLSFFDCPNQLDEDGNLNEFEIAIGESVYVKTMVLPSGVIGTTEKDDDGETLDPCSIVTGKDLTDTPYVSAYDPNVVGVNGVYYKKLATLKELGADGSLVIEYFLAGDNILHQAGWNADLTLKGVLAIGNVYAGASLLLTVRNGIIKGFTQNGDPDPPAGTVMVEV